MIFDVGFPITDGAILGELRTGLNAAWGAGLSVGRKRPETMTRRVVTLRNDSGPQEGVQSFRRYGVNVWADNSLDAEKIALDAMRLCRLLPRNIESITLADSFSGPYEIEDDPAYTVADKNLFHFYFAFRVGVKGSNPV